MLLIEWGPRFTQALFIAVAYAVVLIGCAFRMRAALWVLFVILIFQTLSVESKSFTCFANAGCAIRVALVAGPSFLDSGVAYHAFNGYLAHFAFGSGRSFRFVTNGVSVLSAVALNVTTLIPMVMLWPVLFGRKEKKAVGPVVSDDSDCAR